MLTIFVVDKSAESRNRLLRVVDSLLDVDGAEYDLLPQISLKPVAPTELRFQEVPDICIVGDELLTVELTEVGKIRKLLPDTPILVKLNEELERIAIVEQLARMGADDTLPEGISSKEFLRKIILLARKASRSRQGKLLLVDSGKGGVGVTSVAAALAETLFQGKKKVAVIDFDVETQDLSRFLQARPYVNENLQLLFDRSRPVTEEFVMQSLVRVWEDESDFYCLPPVLETESLYDPRSNYARILLSVLEVLDSCFDYVIVDAGGVRGALQETLYRVADKVVFVVNNDPATLYACADKATKGMQLLAPNAELVLVENAPARTGLPSKVLREEFSRALGVPDDIWVSDALPFCRNGCRWPGSGATIATLGKGAVGKALSSLTARLGLQPPRSRLFGRKSERAFWRKAKSSKVPTTFPSENQTAKTIAPQAPAESSARKLLPEMTGEQSSQVCSPATQTSTESLKELNPEDLISRASVH